LFCRFKNPIAVDLSCCGKLRCAGKISIGTFMLVLVWGGGGEGGVARRSPSLVWSVVLRGSVFDARADPGPSACGIGRHDPSFRATCHLTTDGQEIQGEFFRFHHLFCS
jgi:hypothetical protein